MSRACFWVPGPQEAGIVAFLINSPSSIYYVFLVSAVSGSAGPIYGTSACFVTLSAFFIEPDSHWMYVMLLPATTSQIIIIFVSTLLLLVRWKATSALHSLLYTEKNISHREKCYYIGAQASVRLRLHFSSLASPCPAFY